MASFALLPIFSGFTFDLPRKHIGFSPITEGDFRSFWSLGTGWGNFIQTDSKAVLEIYEGSLTLSSFSVGGGRQASAVFIDGASVSFTQKKDRFFFDLTTVSKQIEVLFS